MANYFPVVLDSVNANLKELLAGDNLNLTGSNLVTTSTSIDVLNTEATTVNAFGDATNLNLGNATSATLLARPGTVVGYNTTQNLWNTTATTINFAGAATTLNIGAATGTLTIGNTTLAAKAITASTTLSVTGAATLSSTLAVTGATTVTNSTATTSASTGALVVTGGIGLGGALYATGNITSAGDVISLSDKRVKSDIKPIENPLDVVEKINGVTFVKNGDTKRTTGVIAQDVLDALPEAVHIGEDGILSVAYGNLVGLLVEAIKDQQKQINELRAKIGE